MAGPGSTGVPVGQPGLAAGRGEIAFPGGTIELGSPRGAGFAFDNESPPYSCYVASFSIDACAVSNAQYADFVADGGYQNRQFWSAAGSAWLMQQERSSPLYWAARSDTVAHHAFRPAHDLAAERSRAPHQPV